MQQFEYTGEGGETLLLRKRKISLEKNQIIEALDEEEEKEIAKHHAFKIIVEKKFKGGKK